MSNVYEDKVEINEIINRYYLYVDDDQKGQDWADLWTEDGVFKSSYVTAKGKAELLKFIVDHIPKARGNRHMTTNAYIEVKGDTASARTLMVVVWGGSPPPKVQASAFCNWEFKRVNQTWKISKHWFETDPSFVKPELPLEAAKQN